ncbi:MAG: energy transducer TonB [Pseudomonadota bacterium]
MGNSLLRHLSGLFLLALLLLPAAGRAAQEAAEIEHTQAVRELLIALRIPEVFRFGLVQTGAGEHPLHEFMAHLGRTATNAELLEIYIPAYAPHVTTIEAKKGIAMFASGTSKAALAMTIDNLGNSRAAALLWTPAQKELMAKFESDGRGRWYLDLNARANADATRASQRWFGEKHTAALMRGVQALALHTKAYADGDHKLAPTAFIPEKTGISYIDETTRVMAETAGTNLKAEWQLDQDLKELGIEALFQPATISSPEKVAAARIVVERIDARVEAFLGTADSNTKSAVAALKAIEMPWKEAFHQGLESALERKLDWYVRFAENQRGMIDVTRRMLAFADSRKGRIKLQEGTLYFDTMEDSETFNRLAAEMRRGAEKIDILRNEAMQRVVDLGNGKVPRAIAQMRPQADATNSYASILAKIIEYNTTYDGDTNVPGNPRVVFEIIQLPTGEVASVRKVAGSGIPGFDTAVERGILKSSPLPKKTDGTVERKIELAFSLKSR